MKLGYRTTGLEDVSWEKSFSILNKIGYDFVEICLEGSEVLKGGDPKADQVKTWLNKNELEASISYHGDDVSLKEKIENTYKAIEYAGQLPVEIVIINAEAVKPGQKQEQFDDLISRYRDFCAAAKEEDIILAVEPEPDLVVHGLEDTLQLLKEVNSSHLGVNLDVGHAYITDDDLAKVINQLGDSIIHVHLEDIANKKHKHLIPGHGDIDFHNLISSLKDINYNGPLVFDLFGLDENNIECAEKSYSFLKKIL